LYRGKEGHEIKRTIFRAVCKVVLQDGVDYHFVSAGCSLSISNPTRLC